MERDTQQPEFKQKDIEASILALNSVMEDDPTSEKPLDSLIQVEEALRTMLELKELSKETKAEIDRVLIGLTGRTISGFLDEIHERAFRVMKSDSAEAKEDIEGYLAKLKIVYRKVERVILTPDKLNGYIKGSGNGIEQKELKTNKLQHLLELLRENEIYTDDICIVIGENAPNMMRKGSYLLIEIPKFKRTILLHLGYKEASFVLYNIYDRGTVFSMTKQEIQEQFGAVKVEYTENDLIKWETEMMKALKLNEATEQPKVDMENYDMRLLYIEEIKKMFPTPEEFMALTSKQKLEIKIQGNGLMKIGTIITGQVRLKVIGSLKDTAIFAKEVYGEGHLVIERELWDRERWIKEIRDRIKTVAEFLGLSVDQRATLKFHGRGLVNLATIILGSKGYNPKSNPESFAKLAEEIYGQGHKEIELRFYGRDEWIEEIKKKFSTPEEFMTLTKELKHSLKINGKGLVNLATIIRGQAGLKPESKNQDLAMLAREIYGVGHKIIECEFWNQDEWIREIKGIFPTPEEFMELNRQQRHDLKIHDKGLSVLASIIVGQKGLKPLGKISDMAKLARTIYGEGHIVIECELWGKDKWTEEIKKLYPTPEDLMALNDDQRLKLKIHGKGISVLASLITGQYGLQPANVNKDLALFAREIYGEGHNIIECEFWDKERWIKEIVERYPTPETILSLYTRQRVLIKFYGKGLTPLARIITGQTGLNPNCVLHDLKILTGAIYGNQEKL